MGLFENAIACFIGYYEAAYETGLKKNKQTKKMVPQNRVGVRQTTRDCSYQVTTVWMGWFFICLLEKD